MAEPSPEAPGAASDASPSSYVRSSYAVWEITLKCNLACLHCGSRAGDAREQELSTEEALDLVRQMAEVGITEVGLIGGEAFLRRDWLEIARAIGERGMLCSMTTGGYGVSRESVRRMKEAGIAFVSVSVDGLERNHDWQRGRDGSWKWCFRTMEFLREEGITFGCNTQINRLTAPEIPRLYEHVLDAGASSWQIQMTNPMGNAADRPEILLQPAELLVVYPMLARVAHRANSEGLTFLPGSSIGYFGPYEEILRGAHMQMGQFWMGCQAGVSAIGIESNGNIKGDPSLPSDAYTGGNIREMSLEEILHTPELTFNLNADSPEVLDSLWGFCRQCDFAQLCRGGCSWSSHVYFGKRGNNAFCHHRVISLARQGKREMVQQVTSPQGLPFDFGVYSLREEALDAPWPEEAGAPLSASSIVWPESFRDWPVF